MKNLKKLFVSFLAMLTAVSCGDPELPVELQPEMQYGAYARKMSQTGKFDFFDIPNSKIDIHVEYYDDAKGANIASFDIDVEYIDQVGGGAGSVTRRDVRTIQASEFVVNSDGYLSSDISLSFTEALSSLGLAETDVFGGNYFRYWFTITKTDGTVYDYNNTGPNLMSSNAFAALFRLNANIVCPSDWTLGAVTGQNGDDATISANGYTYTATDVPLTLSKVSGKENQYRFDDMSVGARNAVFGIATLTGPVFTDVCNIVTMDGVGDYGWGFSLVPSTMSVSTDGKTLQYHWTSEFGEGGAVTAVYNDGSSWPNLTN